MREYVLRLLDQFNIEGTFLDECPYGSGHINDTRLVTYKTEDGEKKYILQRINKNVFKEPDKLMENYVAVTEFLKKDIIARGGDPMRETLNVIRTKDGKNFLCDEKGEYWRLLIFVADSASFDRVETPEQFYSSAVAFGGFQYMLRKFPAETLHETIPNFHNTRARYEKLIASVAADPKGRAAEVREELDWLAQTAKEDIAPRVRLLAARMGIDYGRITFRFQHTRWGSCSAKGNLNFNCLLMLCPELLQKITTILRVIMSSRLTSHPIVQTHVATME